MWQSLVQLSCSCQQQILILATTLFLSFYGVGSADPFAFGQDEIKQVKAQQTDETAAVENAEATAAAVNNQKASPAKRISFVPEFKPDDVRPHVEYLASDDLRGRSGVWGQAAARYIEDHFRKLKLLPLFDGEFLQAIPGPPREDGRKTIYGQNVGAWLPGSDPKLRDEFVIVSAHYDHLGMREGRIFHGADDNASGTSMVLEVARKFALLEHRPARSMVFLAFDLEEHMLWGSRWFASHAPWKMEQIKLFITADMIGRSLGNLPISTAFVMGSEHGSTLPGTLDEVGEPTGFNIARMGIDLIGTRSDYGPFRDRKVPFLFFSTGEHPDYHKPTDTAEKINYEQVAAVSSLVFRVTKSVADSKTPPEWVEQVEPQLEEVRAVHRISELLLEAGRNGDLNTFQQFIVTQAEVQTRQILERGEVTPEERVGLIRTAQILLLSVF
ncbi:MAG: M28 family peptidase [Planctomycetota bacterium]|nr:M28 family peptidase [Planctomycetota bacterium]MDA0920228.1 M28 family peptidase [Planctomycetota bacterium]